DALLLEAPRRSLRAGGAQGAGAQAAADAERARPTPGAAGLAFSLAQPGFGPRRLAAELARKKSGGLRISANGVWRVLRRHGLSTRTRRLSLVAGYAASYERRPALPEPERHVEASWPGQLVGLDCFYIGRLAGTKGAVWQYSDVKQRTGTANPAKAAVARKVLIAVWHVLGREQPFQASRPRGRTPVPASSHFHLAA